MQKTKIEWCDYTWNPITGCKRGCYYCYAERIHNRFYKIPFSAIIIHPNRFGEPRFLKKPSIIFCGSMSDIEYWTNDMKSTVIQDIKAAPHHTFMFLSKSPYSYEGIKWPENTMQGLTMELTQTQDCQLKRAKAMLNLPRPFLSIEPLLGELKIKIIGFEKIIVGAMTGPGAIKPKYEWIQSISDNVPKEKIFWKSNIMEQKESCQK